MFVDEPRMSLESDARRRAMGTRQRSLSQPGLDDDHALLQLLPIALFSTVTFIRIYYHFVDYNFDILSVLF